MDDSDSPVSQSLEPPPEQLLRSDWHHWTYPQLLHMTEMSSTKLIRTTEKRQLATQVGPPHQIAKTNQSESPLQDSGLGGCDPLERLDNHRGLPNDVPEVPETTLSAWKIS